jgi:hypothetical protein
VEQVAVTNQRASKKVRLLALLDPQPGGFPGIQVWGGVWSLFGVWGLGVGDVGVRGEGMRGEVFWL